MTEEGSNLINASMMRALVRRETKLLKQKADACAAVNAHHKKIKTYGINVKNFKAVFDQIACADEGDGYIQNLREQQRLAKLLELPIGHQFNMIDEFDAAQKVDEEIGVKAYRMGARAHMDGVEESANPHPANTVEGQEWLKGYRWSLDLCGTGEFELKALDENAPHPDDAAEGTLPANPTKKRGRPKKNANGADSEAPAAVQ